MPRPTTPDHHLSPTVETPTAATGIAQEARVATGALRGAGDVRFPFVANVFAHWVVGFPAAIVLGFTLHYGARGLWWGLTAGLVFVSVLLAGRFWILTRSAIARV